MSLRYPALFIGIGLLVTLLPHIGPLAAQPAAQQPSKVRVGVYDARAVAIAYVRANRDREHLNQLRAELHRAEKAGNTKQANEIRSQGERLQTLRHLQGFAGARVDDIIVTLNDQLPTIAAEAGVVLIADRIDYRAADVETVDVTDQLVRQFDPDEKTLKIIGDLRSQPPAKMLDVLGLKAGE